MWGNLDAAAQYMKLTVPRSALGKKIQDAEEKQGAQSAKERAVHPGPVYAAEVMTEGD
jgi:hypothetical protein